MVCMCSTLLFYVFFLVIFLCDIDCLQKIRGIRSPQSTYDQQQYMRDKSQSLNKGQTINENINSFDIIVLEAPTDSQPPSNRYESQPITVAADKVQLLSLLFDGSQEPQNRLQANFPQQNLKPLPLKIETEAVQHREPLNTRRDSLPSDSWRPPVPPPPPGPSHPLSDRTPPYPPPPDSWRPPSPTPGGGLPPPKDSGDSPFNDMSPPHHQPHDFWRPPPPPPGSGPPPPPPHGGPPPPHGGPPPPHGSPPPLPEPDHSHPSPPNGKYRDQRDPPPHSRERGPPPHSRGRGPPPHARGHGPPHKEYRPPRPNWDSNPEDERHTYNEQSDSNIKAPTQRPPDKTNGQDTDYTYNNNAVYDRNQGRGVPLTNNQGKANIQLCRPQQHLFQVVPVTPAS